MTREYYKTLSDQNLLPWRNFWPTDDLVGESFRQTMRWRITLLTNLTKWLNGQKGNKSRAGGIKKMTD